MTGRTVLFVSHSIDSVRRLCTRGILLEHGRVVADGKATEIAEQYQSATDDKGESILPGPETIWTEKDAPKFPNRNARLRAVRAIDDARTARNSYDVTESFCIEIEYEVMKPGPLLSAHLYFYDAAGSLAFASLDNLDTPYAGRVQPAGIHRCRCRVPAHLLNEGIFSIEYTLCTNPTTDQYATAPGCLVLTITDARRPGGVRGDWSRDWFRCPVRPRLAWEFDQPFNA
jgi:lipopolysaccharide transport system ATP-binding protein